MNDIVARGLPNIHTMPCFCPSANSMPRRLTNLNGPILDTGIPESRMRCSIEAFVRDGL